jgi:hypothetical protein
LICRFCSQWNPEGELRCCFCNNRLDGTEDATLAGAPAYTQRIQVPLASPDRSATGPSLVKMGRGVLEQVREAGGLSHWVRGLDSEQRTCLVAGIVVLLGIVVIVLCC